MNRELTKREKVLLLIFVVLIIVLGYFKLILEPINTKIDSYEGMTLEEEMEIDTKTIKAVQMSIMEKEIEKAKAEGVKRDVPDYDNSAVLLPKLYKIMDSTIEYSMDFSELQTEGKVVLRQVNISFDTRGYKQARKIIDRLYDMGYALQIDDITSQRVKATDRSRVTTYLNVTFFEAVRE